MTDDQYWPGPHKPRKIWSLPCGCARYVVTDPETPLGERIIEVQCGLAERIETMVDRAEREFAEAEEHKAAERWGELFHQRADLRNVHTQGRYDWDYGQGHAAPPGEWQQAVMFSD